MAVKVFEPNCAIKSTLYKELIDVNVKLRRVILIIRPLNTDLSDKITFIFSFTLYPA